MFEQWGPLSWLGFGLAVAIVVFLLSGFRFIRNDRIGIVEMRLSPKGSLDGGIIALNGEAGFQPQVLRGGLHYLLPIQFAVHVQSLVTIPQGKIGYVFARDGRPLPPSQALASNAAAQDLQDVAAFLRQGGQRGPQRKIIREGTYAINLAQFVVITEERLYFHSLDKTEQDLFRAPAMLNAERGGLTAWRTT